MCNIMVVKSLFSAMESFSKRKFVTDAPLDFDSHERFEHFKDLELTDKQTKREKNTTIKFPVFLSQFTVS